MHPTVGKTDPEQRRVGGSLAVVLALLLLAALILALAVPPLQF